MKLKKTIHLEKTAAEQADELAYVRGFSGASTFIESLINKEFRRRQRNLVRVDLVPRRT